MADLNDALNEELNEQQTLPLLPLTSGVVLPGMVFTLALESEEAKVAAEAAGSAGGRLVLVPHIEGRYATIGVISEIVELGQLPGGADVAVIRGLRRAVVGSGVPGTGRALWVQAEPVFTPEPTTAAVELEGVPRRAREHPVAEGSAAFRREAARHRRSLRDGRPGGVLP